MLYETSSESPTRANLRACGDSSVSLFSTWSALSPGEVSILHSAYSGGGAALWGVTDASVTDVQAIVLALLQGVSELFPISSLGHTILLPAVLHWNNIDRSDPTFLAFVVVLHLGTAVFLLVFYWKQWVAIARALIASGVIRGKLSDDRDERIGWLLVVGTIPVGILGVLFQDPVRTLFASPAPVALFLAANGLVMFAGEALRRRQLAQPARADRPIEHLSFAQSVLVGFAQSLALLPGISRSGASMVAGLLCDLDHEDAAKYSFLLATPVILAAALLEIPKLTAPGAHVVLLQAVLGGVVAAIAAYASVAFLTRYFKSNDLRPFGWYCLLAGVACFILTRMGVLTCKPPLLLAVAFFIIGLLYGLGILNLFAKAGDVHHIKHLIVCWILALLCLVWTRFLDSAASR